MAKRIRKFGSGGSSSEPKRYIKRDSDGARPASKPPVYQKEVAIRRSSEVGSPRNSSTPSASAKSTAIKPKVYEGELNSGEVATRGRTSGNIGRDALEGERVVAKRGSSSPSSNTNKGVSTSSSSAKSTAIKPKVYEGELSGSTPGKYKSSTSSGSTYEGERVSKPVSKSSVGSNTTGKSTASLGSKSTSSLPSSTVSEGSFKEMPKGVTARKVTSSAVKGLGKLASGLGGASMLLEPSELGNSSLSNKESAEMVKRGAFKQDEDSSVASAKSRAANREVMYGTQKAETPTPPKKSEAPVAVVKKQTTVVSKPKGPSEGARARAALQEFRDWNASREPLDTSAAEDMNTQGKLDAAEDSEYKKGGQIKRRPPKPAKKAPAKRFASGGMSRSSASKRGDGCATRGLTRGKYL